MREEMLTAAAVNRIRWAADAATNCINDHPSELLHVLDIRAYHA